MAHEKIIAIYGPEIYEAARRLHEKKYNDLLDSNRPVSWDKLFDAKVEMYCMDVALVIDTIHEFENKK